LDVAWGDAGICGGYGRSVIGVNAATNVIVNGYREFATVFVHENKFEVVFGAPDKN
jgi:hypothetical protein